MKKTLLTISLTCFTSLFTLFAQNKIIKGRVTEAGTNEALPGVNVVIKGTRQGVATDIDGRFSLTVPQGTVLVFSFVGMRTQEVYADGFVRTEKYHLRNYAIHKNSDVVRTWKQVKKKLKLPEKAIGILKD